MIDLIRLKTSLERLFVLRTGNRRVGALNVEFLLLHVSHPRLDLSHQLEIACVGLQLT